MIVLKIILWVILSVLVLSFAALFIPVRICVDYTTEARVVLKYLFLKIPLVPQKEKKKKKKNPGKQPSEKKKPDGKKKKEESEIRKYLKSLHKSKGIDGLITLVRELAGLATGTLRGLFKHIIFKRFDINVTVATGDAADTAIKYGYVCAGVYPALSLVLNAVRYKDYTVNISADFDRKKPMADCKIQANILPLFAVKEAVKLLLRFVELKKNDVL